MKAFALALAATLLLCGCSTTYTTRTARIEPANEAPEPAAVKTADQIVIAPPPPALPEYEKLTYRVQWLGVHVGTITASINGIRKIRGRDAYELEITADTNQFLSKLYPVHDRYVSYLDTEQLRTLRHEVYRREGRYRKDAITDFDYTAGVARFRNLLDKSEKTVPIPPDIQDPVTMAYFFRTVPLRLCERREFHVYNNESVYALCGIADRKEFVRIPKLGMREAFHIQPYALLNGESVRKGKASAYFSCDEKRVPLIGSVRAPLFTEVVGYLDAQNDAP